MTTTTFKTIKVSAGNASAIEASLKNVNGRATTHSFTKAAEIIKCAEQAEAATKALLASQKESVGVSATFESGDQVANAYNNMRTGTRVMLMRRTSGWFIVDMQSFQMYRDGGHSMRLFFTPEHDARAIAVLRSRYQIKKPAAAPVRYRPYDHDTGVGMRKQANLVEQWSETLSNLKKEVPVC